MKRCFLLVFILFCIILPLLFTGCFTDSTKDSATDQSMRVLLNETIVCDSLAEAIMLAENQDTIKLLNGSFTAGISINKTIHIKGMGENETIIHSTDQSDAAFTIESNHCVIENLSIISSNPDVHGIKINSTDNQLLNVSITQSFYGLYITKKSHNNSFNHVQISDCSYGGLIKSSNHNSFNNCMITNAAYYGLFFIRAKNSVVTNSDFSFCSYYGVYVDSGSDHSRIQGCNFSRNGAGLRLKSVTECYCSNSLFKENDNGIILCCGSNNNMVVMNAFVENQMQATDDSGNIWSVNQTGNFWSDYQTTYPSATSQDGIWNQSYEIYKSGIDTHPLVTNPLTE